MKPVRPFTYRLLLLLLCGGGLSFAYRQMRPVEAAPVLAAFVVSNANDSGDGSLRKAILDANALAGDDTITFATPFFSTPRTITLTSGELTINSNLTITGPGANLLTISGNNASRVFNIGSVTVSLSGMTITGGNVGGGASGGGILNDGTLTVSNSTISGNSASIGGGIRNSFRKSLTLLNSTVSNNTADFIGGSGIDNQGSLTVTNSTISGNRAASNGGGIASDSIGSTANITNCTITNNSAVGNSSASGVRNDSGTVTLRNNIIAGNVNNSTIPDVFAAAGLGITSNGFNLIGNRGTLVGVFNQTGDQAGDGATQINPFLSPLANNGGATQTHAFAALSSTAIDRGHSSGANTDQRGAGRPFDNLNITNVPPGSDGADIGAYEQSQSLVVNVLGEGNGDGICNADCSLREAIGAATVSATSGDAIFFSALFNTPQTITLTSGVGQLAINKNLTINGPGAHLLTISGNNASRVFQINSGFTVSLGGMTITGGNPGNEGGGIFNIGNLTVSNCHITGNSASFGGGIRNGNSASLVLLQSTVSGNTIFSGGGGGIDSGGPLTVTNSTISGNSVLDTFGINNCGGIRTSNTATITNSTITNNSAAGANSVGGVFRNNGTVTLRNSIIAGNSPNSLASGTGGGGAETITSLGFNLTNDNSLQTLQFLNQPTDFVNTNPLLGPLQDNGGPTATHALRFGSRALDAGHSSGAPTDQRGLPRRVDLATINNERDSDGADIGAVEAQTAPVQVTPALALNDVSKAEGNSGQTPFDFTVTLSEASTQTVTVAFFAQNGTATAGSDYAATEGQLTFTPGQTSKTVTVQVNGDTTVEPDETFTVNLRNATNATIADAQGLGTIVNDDTAVVSLVVQNTNDSNAGSLRQVIADAPAGSVITFAPTVFNVMRTITLASEIQITKSLTINGPGANLLALSGGNNNRVVRVQGSNLNVTLNDLTITGGRATASIGGGILSNSGLTMNRCVIANNFATTSGGGVHLQPGATGIFTACTFNGNTSASGGALYVEGAGNDLILVLTNCTISGNTATATGGALLHAAASGASLTAITNCTIANNESADGGGIFIRATANGATPRATTRNSIFANNTNTNLRVLSENGGTATIMSLGYNLTTGSGSGLLTATGDQINTDPLLGPLQNNGGPTPTRALLFGSPAIDRGNSSGSTSDQRGVRRPVDDPLLLNANGGDGADIGAFERSALAVVSAANFKGAPLAQESIVALFGENLTAGTATNNGLPLPLTLANTSVNVRDAQNSLRAAPLFFVSPGQLNFQIPPDTAVGAATLAVLRDGVVVASVSFAISAVEPGLFTANANGAGVPAAVLVRVRANGTQVIEPVAQFQGGAFVPLPLSLGPIGEQVILVLFGTGLRNRSSLNVVTLNIGAAPALGVDFAGAQGLVGLDQINSRALPRSLAGAGAVNVQLTVDGKPANVVTLNFQ